MRSFLRESSSRQAANRWRCPLVCSAGLALTASEVGAVPLGVAALVAPRVPVDPTQRGWLADSRQVVEIAQCSGTGLQPRCKVRLLCIELPFLEAK